ncbi:MAG: efflux RND transporter permease subunit [Halohasta sp.]
MSEPGLDVDPVVERVNHLVLERPLAIIVGFLLVTAVLGGGLGLITTETDSEDSFTSDTPEEEALEAVEDEFESPFGDGSASTQLIQSSDNALAPAELERSLQVAETAERRSDLRVDSVSGPASTVAKTIDPEAESPAEQREAIERATPTEIREAIRENADDPSFEAGVSEDFNEESATATGTISTVQHDFPSGEDTDDELQDAQVAMKPIAEDAGGDVRVFGSGITDAENATIIGDSLSIVVPAVLGLILLFLIIAYRDPFDLILGLAALVMTLVWTFGFMGYVGIPFDQNMIAVPVLLAAVSIDFGIHIINRYREERVKGYNAVESMSTANEQLIVAFAIVTMTTIVGFMSNLASSLGPIQNFGIVAAIGISFTFVIFSVFLPAAKLFADEWRDRLHVPAFGTRPLATEESALGRLLALPAKLSYRAPLAFFLVFLLVSAGAADYGQGVDQSFDTDDFQPPEELPVYIEALPEPFAPGEYTVTENLNFLDDNFEIDQQQGATIYIEGPMEEEHSLESLDRALDDPPDSYVSEDREAEAESILTVIDEQAERDEEFAELVDRNDRDGNGVPDRNLNQIYDELFASEAGDQAEQYLTEDRRATQVEFDIESDASQSTVTEESREYSDDFRFSATATGLIVVFDAVSDIIFESAIQSLSIALTLTALFLIFVYWLLEREPLLGLVNLFPIVVSVTLLIASMRAFGLSLNALTATILSITIGIGIDFSVHTTHRFIDEYRVDEDAYRSLVVCLYGTGGALTGAMLTTSIGTGALVLAITPILGQFGLLMALSVFLSYLAAIVALPPAVYVWAWYKSDDASLGRLLWANAPSTGREDY